jgi:hypothetical protein
MRRKLTSRLLVIGSACLTLVLVASPAHADGYDVAQKHGLFQGGHDGPCKQIFTDNSNGKATFCGPGDVFHIDDLDSDGRSVGVKWDVSYGTRSGLCRWAGGYPDSGDCN